jgi:hypothetical protein
MFGKKAQDILAGKPNKKLCPLGISKSGTTGWKKLVECIESECMWWNEEEQDCNINVIAKKLIELTKFK